MNRLVGSLDASHEYVVINSLPMEPSKLRLNLVTQVGRWTGGMSDELLGYFLRSEEDIICPYFLLFNKRRLQISSDGKFYIIYYD